MPGPSDNQNGASAPKVEMKDVATVSTKPDEETVDSIQGEVKKGVAEMRNMIKSYDESRQGALKAQAKKLYELSSKILEIKNKKAMDQVVDKIFTPYAGVLAPFVQERGRFGLNGRALLQLFSPSCPHCVTMASILEEAFAPFPEGLVYGLDVSCLGDPKCELAKFIRKTFLEGDPNIRWDGRVPAFYSMSMLNDQIVYMPFVLQNGLDRNSTIDRLRQSVLAVEMSEYSSLIQAIGQRDVLNGQIRGLKTSIEDSDELMASMQPVEEISVKGAWERLLDPTNRNDAVARKLMDSVNALQATVRDERQRSMLNQSNLLPKVLGGLYDQLAYNTSEGLQGDRAVNLFLQALRQ